MNASPEQNYSTIENESQSSAIQSSRLPAQPIDRALRREILVRDNLTCRYCGGSSTTIDAGPDGYAWEVDHVLPLCRGGETTPANLAASCRTCNSRKGRQHPENDWQAAFDARVRRHYFPAIRKRNAERARQRVDELPADQPIGLSLIAHSFNTAIVVLRASVPSRYFVEVGHNLVTHESALAIIAQYGGAE